MANLKLGYTESEIETSPYGGFFNPVMEPLQAQVNEAIMVGPQAHELFPTVASASRMAEPGYWPEETGYTKAPDSSIRVFCLTNMPEVSPDMWAWWFGWHGCEALRYKLWHPKAHIEAKWADGRDDEKYMGRTSLITEYIGADLKKAAISFLRPSELGFDEAQIEARGEVIICARVGIPGLPIKGGWLLHQLRPVEAGCEMRSRMWFGGENAAIGQNPGPVRRGIMRALRPFSQILLPNPADLLVHNAQEMAHLAGFLPELHAKFASRTNEEAS